MYQAVLAETLARGATPREQVERWVEESFRKYMRERDERFNQSAIEAQTRERVDAAVGKVAWLIVRRATEQRGLRVEKSFIGDLCKRVNSQKKRDLGHSVKECGKEQLELHYRWIKTLEAKILSGEMPEWLR
jgi:hypothetical protein